MTTETDDKWQRPEWVCPVDMFFNLGVRDRCRNCYLPRRPEDDLQGPYDPFAATLFHPDPEIDAEVRADIAEGRRYDWKVMGR